MEALRYYNDKGQLVGYADENYAFTCKRDAEGNMIDYQNTKEESVKIDINNLD